MAGLMIMKGARGAPSSWRKLGRENSVIEVEQLYILENPPAQRRVFKVIPN
jgi:hypothetical protein